MIDQDMLITLKLRSNTKFLVKCLLRLHDQQLDDEQTVGETIHDNGKGFNKGDSAFLTAVVKSLRRKATELEKPVMDVPFDGVMLEEVRHKLRKYIKQLSTLLTEEEIL